MLRTNIEIDDGLMSEALRLTGLKTKTSSTPACGSAAAPFPHPPAAMPLKGAALSQKAGRVSQKAPAQPLSGARLTQKMHRMSCFVPTLSRKARAVPLRGARLSPKAHRVSRKARPVALCAAWAVLGARARRP
ncbi:type II toxin-antitoxin system VapB family antitoxin [Aquabacterium sp.]|uniref:type II toxin-antitoxin system VapB family antitoxin n=1 Tax=Aquabacterium sp. TaxID=1872578 RepID=UPI0035C73F30